MGKRKEEQKVENTGFVVIQSNVTVRVYPGVFYDNVSQPEAHTGDRLKVIAKWAKYGVLIRKGAYQYAAEIAEWPTVKAMVEKGTMSLGGRSETTNDKEAIASKEIAEEAKEQAANSENKVSLEDLAE